MISEFSRNQLVSCSVYRSKNDLYVLVKIEHSITSDGLCQSVISGSLTLSDTKIRDFGVKFYFSKFRMEPVMLSFLAPTENTK